MRPLIIMLFSLFLSACSSVYENQKLLGKTFPTVSGESLAGQPFTIPEDFNNPLTLLLIGYKQNAQFDIDRWFIGLDMTETTLPIYELPTILGMFPRMISPMIDNGMRKGIPEPLWKAVITIYKDGEQVQRFTGNKNPNNARVVLINQSGKILYFYDQGFSVQALNNLRAVFNAYETDNRGKTDG